MSREAYHKAKKSLVIDIDEVNRELNEKFQQYWEPFTDVVIDESLVPTKAHCPFTVMIKQKPHPKEVKL